MAPAFCTLARSWLLLVVACAWIGATSLAAAQQPRPARPPGKPPAADEQAIRAAAQAYAKAYNAGDAKALAALWTVDGDYTDESGRTFQGRPEIEAWFAAAFAGQPGVKLEVRTESIRFLSPEVALETGTAWAIPSHGNPTSARYSAVQVKRDGNWLLASVRDSARVAESNSEFLRELEWLVGSWRAEAGDIRLNAKVAWSENNNFLVRNFSSEGGGKPVRSGTQIIGWDPRGGQIVSWHFDSDGGFGTDRWIKQGARWVIVSSSVLRDGGASTATNILTPLDANSFTWQSIDRAADGAALPDTEPVKMTREASGR